MNYRTLVKGAFALSLSLIVGSASASTTTTNDVQKYGAMFETTANTPVGAFNDYDYTLDANITNYFTVPNGGNPYGWFGGDSDESKIVSANNGQALQLNTDAGTLTNLFAEGVAADLNAGIADAGAYFETEVKFVPSDTLDAGIQAGQDATKFAIYAYADENNNTTNLVVFHKYNLGGVIGYTNEQFGAVDCDAYTKLRVEMMQAETRQGMVNVFSVKVNDGAALTSDLAYKDGIWFLTVENNEVAANMDVSSLNFKGTGEIDNIKAGVITTTTTYAIDWTGSQNVVVSNGTEEVSGTTGNYEAGTVLTFYPTVGLITNVANAAVDPAAASWPYTVSADDTFTVLAGEEPVAPTTYTLTITYTGAGADTPAQYVDATLLDGATYSVASPEVTGYTADPATVSGTIEGADVSVTVTYTANAPAGYNENDSVAGVTLTQAQADWLNGLRGQTSTTDYTSSITTAGTDLNECYLLNCDPTVAGNGGTLSITAITVGNEVSVTVALDRTGELGQINGTLKLLGGSDLTGFGSTSVVDLSAVKFAEDGTSTASFSAGQNKFFKAVIE